MWLKVVTFVKNNKKLVIVAVIALALFAVGFMSGRYTTKPKIVEKEKIVTQTVDKVVYQDRVVERKVYVQVKQQNTHTVTETTKKPDGTITTKVDQTTATNTNTGTQAEKQDDKTKQEVKTVVQIVEKEKKVDVQPNWRATVGAGVSIPYYVSNTGDIGIPGMKGVVVNASIDRRIAGPFYLGIHGNTQGVLGLQVSGQW